MPDDSVTILNDLIEVSKDGEQGFAKAAEDTHDASLKTLFTDRAASCRAAVQQLQDAVIKLGGKPETSGSLSGALHRGWVDVRAAMSNGDAHAILSECERGEDVAKKRYRDALDKDLPADVRALVERQYQGVLQNHDRIRELRDQYAAAR